MRTASDGLVGDVVVRGPNAAGREHVVETAAEAQDGRGNVVDVVRHHFHAAQLDARLCTGNTRQADPSAPTFAPSLGSACLSRAGGAWDVGAPLGGRTLNSICASAWVLVSCTLPLSSSSPITHAAARFAGVCAVKADGTAAAAANVVSALVGIDGDGAEIDDNDGDDDDDDAISDAAAAQARALAAALASKAEADNDADDEQRAEAVAAAAASDAPTAGDATVR